MTTTLEYLPVSLGVIILLYTLVLCRRTYKLPVEKSVKNVITVSAMMIAFFVVGYVLFLTNLKNKIETQEPSLLIPSILFFGALYVAVSINTLYQSLKRILSVEVEARRSLEENKISLEKELGSKMGELERSEKKIGESATSHIKCIGRCY